MNARFVHRKTVTAAIDATALERGKFIAVRYVKRDGTLNDYLIRKLALPERTRSKGKAGQKKPGQYRIKEAAQIRVIMEHHKQPRTLDIFALTHANLEGDPANLYRIEHE